MFTKWVISGIDEFRFGEDGNLYRLPYIDKAGKYRDWRLIKEQRNNWKIKGVWYSKKQLKPKLILDPEPMEIVMKDEKQF